MRAAVLSIPISGIAMIVGAAIAYQATGGRSCARCHEIQPAVDLWNQSTHRSVPCAECHGGLFTFEFHFHWKNFRQLLRHLAGRVPQQIVLRERREIDRAMAACRRCHEQEYARWQAGPHSVTYRQIFLDEQHNRKRLLMDDCLRCHGMHYPGNIAALVTPVDTRGPWRLLDQEMENRPTIPCLACHEIHRRGQPMGPQRRPRRAGPQQEEFRPSLALFDRRTQTHFSVASMPVPQVYDNGRPLVMSRDPRQALCYQCHAPLATAERASGDDRTCRGVHEGLSCLACHEAHGQDTRASCKNCHPRLSNCGLDVETMDTTFKDPASKHNIHFVQCSDCHPKGVPRRARGERGLAEARRALD